LHPQWNGVVAQFTLRYPTGEIATHQGRFQIISLSGTILKSPTLTSVGGLTIYLASSEGHLEM